MTKRKDSATKGKATKSPVAAKKPPKMCIQAAFMDFDMERENRANTEFTKEEESYIDKEPRAERARLRKLISKAKSVNTVPRRVRLLKSSLDCDLKLDVFQKLARHPDPKFVQWVEEALKIPIETYTPRPSLSQASCILKRARAVMDQEISGHVGAKHEVMRLLSNWMHDGGGTGFALALEGQPGIGKTSFAKSALAKSLNRPFCFIGLGGASDASMLLGHSYTYEGAMPGRLVECLTTSKVMDPVIFFDELDKLSTTPKGEEVVNTLIHLTDPVQNTHIVDRYFHGIKLDLSRAILVFSYNDPSRVHPVLLDRLRRVRMTAPSLQEKVVICRRHLAPRYTAEPMEDDVIQFVVDRNREEPGMRGVEKDVEHLVSSFKLVRAYGDPDVLGLDKVSDRLDLSFAKALLESRDPCPRHLGMYL